MESVDPGGPLSDEELRELNRLLARYATRELDQWDAWKIHMYTGPSDPHEYEPVYIVMSRGLLPNWQDKTFTTIWPLPAHLEEDRHGDGNQQ
jgi:hypothetical protein